MGYPVWGFRIEKKSPDFRSPEVEISLMNFHTSAIIGHNIYGTPASLVTVFALA